MGTDPKPLTITTVQPGQRETINALRVRAVLGKFKWSAPEPWGGDSWTMRAQDGDGVVIVSAATIDGADWLHASMSRRDGVPSYTDLKRLHEAVFGAGHAYQVFVPPSRHINVHPRCLHLWGRADGAAVLPDFAQGGMI